MRALTLRAPWGTAIARLGKDIEHRSWLPPKALIGERIAIHQGMSLDREGLVELEEEFGSLEVERGAIVCTAVIRGWIDDEGGHSDSLSAREAARARRSKWYRGGRGWVLDGVRRPRVSLKAKGMLGVWSLPARLSNKLPAK